MKPSELLSKIVGFSEDMRTDGKRFDGSGLQKHKLAEAQDPDMYENAGGETLYDNIKKHGVQSPVVLMGRNFLVLGNGHHRLAVAHQLEKEGHDIVVPVVYGGNDIWADITDSKYFPRNENAERFQS
jgi:hypothetical protein